MNNPSIKRLLPCSIISIFLSNSAGASFLGDINQDRNLDLKDAILALQVVSGTTPSIPLIDDGLDVDEDGTIGVSEAIYIINILIRHAPTKLNDTGITWGSGYPSTNYTTCTGVESGAQDCSHGRDVIHNDDSDGHAGFSFTKLDPNGVPLTNEDADYATTPWACVRDNFTGLIYEVKTDDGGQHDKDDRYNWYNTDSSTNGGAPGYDNDDGPICFGYDGNDPTTFCNTEAYVNRVNAEGWCGASDWRLPTRKELKSIISYFQYDPAIDSNYFPNTWSGVYWSSLPNAFGTGWAWGVDFFGGWSSSVQQDSDRMAVRLVRDGD